MKLYYEERDITARVDITRCIYREAAGGRCDCLEITLDHAGVWDAWGTQADDRIRVTHGDVDTGTLYVNAVIPAEGQYRILATSLPGAARRKAWKTFLNATLADLTRACAAECGMNERILGLDATAVYPFLLRRNEGCAAFLEWILGLEGGLLKAYDGRLNGIGIAYAQGLPAVATIRITENQPGVSHLRRYELKYAGLTVRTPYGSASAEDTGAGGSIRPVIADLPAANDLQAGRWARGLLMQNNRRAETLRLATVYNPALSALARVNVESGTDAAGEWMVDEAEHDFKNNTTTAKLARCVYTVR